MGMLPKTLVCDRDLLDKNLSGRTYIVTGANSGIGLTTSKQLVKQGAHVIMACRNTNEGKRVKKNFEKLNYRGSANVLKLDLADLNCVRDFANLFLNDYKKLDGLINNAGIMMCPKSYTKDGFEMQFGVNHLGHFLLTELLIDVLKNSAPSRIIILSSSAHDSLPGLVKFADIDLKDPHFKEKKYDKAAAYCQSKFANFLHAKSLARRLEGTGVTAISVHPGMVQTNLSRHLMPQWLQKTIGNLIFKIIGVINPEDGAQTSLHTLLDENIPDHPGEYFSQTSMYRDNECNQGGWPMKSPNPKADDRKLEDGLWALSCSEVGITEMKNLKKSA